MSGDPQPRLLRLADAVAQPWRNGGGTTRELLAEPAGEGWRFRVSVATIAADGPFSAYPGVARDFAVLRGAGVRLVLDGAVHERRPGDAPLAFDGAAAPGCMLLDGPTEDLNLMRRGVGGGMARAEAGREWRPGAARGGLYSVGGGTLRAGDAAWPAPPDALLWFDALPPALAFAPAGDAPACWLWIDR